MCWNADVPACATRAIRGGASVGLSWLVLNITKAKIYHGRTCRSARANTLWSRRDE